MEHSLYFTICVRYYHLGCVTVWRKRRTQFINDNGVHRLVLSKASWSVKILLSNKNSSWFGGSQIETTLTSTQIKFFQKGQTDRPSGTIRLMNKSKILSFRMIRPEQKNNNEICYIKFIIKFLCHMENVWGKGYSANTLFNHEVSEPAFSSKPSKHLHTQTVRNREQLRTVKFRIIENLNVVSLFSGNISGTDKFMWRNCIWSGGEFWQLSEVIFLR